MWTDNASEIDMLFYKPYADIVSEAAMGMDQSSLTIGVFGFWGAGKSTLLNLIEKNYKDNKDVICVTINAWMFENYEDATPFIVVSISSASFGNENITGSGFPVAILATNGAAMVAVFVPIFKKSIFFIKLPNLSLIF